MFTVRLYDCHFIVQGGKSKKTAHGAPLSPNQNYILVQILLTTLNGEAMTYLIMLILVGVAQYPTNYFVLCQLWQRTFRPDRETHAQVASGQN